MTAVLVKVVPSPYRVVRATVYKPNLGKQIKKDKLEDVEKKYRKVQSVTACRQQPTVSEQAVFQVAVSAAKSLWEVQYNESLTICTHSFL